MKSENAKKRGIACRRSAIHNNAPVEADQAMDQIHRVAGPAGYFLTFARGTGNSWIQHWEQFMRKYFILGSILVMLIGLLMVEWSPEASAAERIKAPLLSGQTWIKMSPDQKAAYIWGAGDIIDLEQEFMEIYPELRRDSFVTKAVEGIGDVKINAIVINVDTFYKDNPDKVELSVIRVVWETMIRPNLKTGIAGRPLQ